MIKQLNSLVTCFALIVCLVVVFAFGCKKEATVAHKKPKKTQTSIQKKQEQKNNKKTEKQNPNKVSKAAIVGKMRGKLDREFCFRFATGWEMDFEASFNKTKELYKDNTKVTEKKIRDQISNFCRNWSRFQLNPDGTCSAQIKEKRRDEKEFTHEKYLHGSFFFAKIENKKVYLERRKRVSLPKWLGIVDEETVETNTRGFAGLLVWIIFRKSPKIDLVAEEKARYQATLEAGRQRAKDAIERIPLLDGTKVIKLGLKEFIELMRKEPDQNRKGQLFEITTPVGDFEFENLYDNMRLTLRAQIGPGRTLFDMVTTFSFRNGRPWEKTTKGDTAVIRGILSDYQVKKIGRRHPCIHFDPCRVVEGNQPTPELTLELIEEALKSKKKMREFENTCFFARGKILEWPGTGVGMRESIFETDKGLKGNIEIPEYHFLFKGWKETKYGDTIILLGGKIGTLSKQGGFQWREPARGDLLEK